MTRYDSLQQETYLLRRNRARSMFHPTIYKDRFYALKIYNPHTKLPNNHLINVHVVFIDFLLSFLTKRHNVFVAKLNSQ